MGLTSVPTMVAAGWSEAQVRAYRIADNKLALNAGWDDGLLRLELGELRGLEVDLGLLGFGTEELEALFAPPSAGLTDPDEAPEPPARPASVLGDVWLLGRHRLVCGDSTDAGTVTAALGGTRPHLMVTDPPYGVGYDPAWRLKTNRFGPSVVGTVQNDDRADWSPAWQLFPGSVAYVWHGGLHSAIVQASLEAGGFHMRSQIVWAKQHFVFGRGDYHWQHEPCWYGVRGRGKWAGDRKQTTLWTIANHNPMGGKKDDSTSGHGTQKPIECMKRPIENNSRLGQAVYDPFVGSGTTIIAAEMTGRACYAIELSPAYVDVAVRRWQSFTGEEAMLENEGRSFAAVAAERVPYDEDADSLGSYHDAVAAVGKRVKAGAPVPEFFLKQQQGA
jgi:DNA modification methylase